MNLDQVTLEIRPRSAWEATDLGLLMAKRWWLPMTKVWLMVSLPIVIILLFVPEHWFWWSALLLWWIKPLLERPLLHILSHAVFNDLPSTGSTAKLFPSLARKQWFASLTWRRFSPTRGMDLPVLQLEGLSGTRRQDRLQILHRDDSSPASWFSFIGLLLEISLWFGMISFVWVLIPREINIEWANFFFDQDSSQLHLLQLALWYFALSLTAPFYVACGFALYLNRRITLEAWDIDIAFRRIVNKRNSRQPLASLLLFFCLSLGTLIADAQRNAYADENLPQLENALLAEDLNADSAQEEPLGEFTEIDRQQAQDAIKSVLQQPEFSRKEIQRRIKFDEPDEPSTFWKKLFAFLSNIEGFVAAASVLEILLWLTMTALIAFLLYRYRRWLSAQFVRIKPSPTAKAKPVTLFGMEVTRESLPDDISAHALTLLEAGDVRAALALLYRASLFHLVHNGVEIHDGNTERECVELMREHFAGNMAAQPRVEYFSSLTRVWQRLAYGHFAPAADTAEYLCANWNRCWLQQNHPDPMQGAAV